MGRRKRQRIAHGFPGMESSSPALAVRNGENTADFPFRSCCFVTLIMFVCPEPVLANASFSINSYSSHKRLSTLTAKRPLSFPASTGFDAAQPDSLNDAASHWEFWGGSGWVKSVSEARPVFTWKGRVGVGQISFVFCF